MSQLPRNLTDEERRSIASALHGMAAIRRMSASEAIAPTIAIISGSKATAVADKHLAEAQDLERLAVEIVRPGTRLVLERLP